MAAVLGACGGEDADDGTPAAEAVEHVHGLGINPGDGALYIATHFGLFRSPERSSEAERVGESSQDFMGFTVIGPDRFLASGHPAAGQAGPAHLGLLESTDGGRTWQEISLGGGADFHVLRFAHDRVYAYNALTGALMLSDDGGETWGERRPPAPMIDLAVDPTDRERIVASTERGLAMSENDGRRWRPIEGAVGLLAWPERERLYLVDGGGTVRVSKGGAGRWREVGAIGGQPVAFTAVSDNELYAALGDSTVLSSTDGGGSWEVRWAP